MKIINRTRRVAAKMCTQEAVAHNVLTQLQHCYSTLRREEPYEEFLNNFMDLLERDNNTTETTLINDYLTKSENLAPILLSQMRIETAIRIAIFYAHRSNVYFATGDYGRSWYFAAQAARWEGISFGSEHAFFVRMEGGTQLARSGGIKKAERFDPVKKYARSLALERPYPSRRNAALSIKDRVLDFAKQEGINLSEQQAERTLCSWLADIPFASKHRTTASKDYP